MPDLDLVPIEIAKEHVRLARAEFALIEHPATGLLDGAHGGADVRRIDEPKPEMRDLA